MRYKDIKEGVGRITKQNQTVDVGPREIKKQAAKFGNSVDKDGRPPTLSKKVKGKSTNVLFNLGLAEGYKLRLERDKHIDVLHVLDTKTKKRIEVRGKKDYETNYDASDKLHQVLDSVGKAANISELMNGEVVGINPKHPQGADAEKTAKDVLTTESLDNIYESVLYYRQMKENLGEIAQATEIYVDMDGVLADFFGEWAKLMKVDHYSKIDNIDINVALQKIRDTDEFWLKLPLLPQAKQLLSVIKQIKGEYNICSSPLADDPNSEPHKREWIKKNLAFFPPKEVIITHNKPQYATKEDGTPNILIDDYGKNVDAWEAAGGTAFKYKDHKFERTANAIKQHMQEPVTEQETNKKTQNAATTKAKPYDLPIRPDIAELIVQAYPELKRIWVINDKYGIVGTKLVNGPTVYKLQRQLKKDGYPITVDGKAGKDTDKMFKHWLGNVIYYIKHDYLGESVTEGEIIRGKTA